MSVLKCAALIAAGTVVSSASAAIVTLTPDQINGGDTNTSEFDNGEIRITALIGNTPATFNTNAGRLGVDDQGTNGQAFNDPDTDPNNGNEEKLVLEFVATSGLTQLSWDFSRADGGASVGGVMISGFLADPNASFSGRNFDPNGILPDLSSTYDAGTGTLYFELPFNIAFGNDDGFLDLANAAASAGTTLTISAFDTDQAGAQLAITSISYNNAVPTPGAAGVLGLALAAATRRRR
jgi:hypothetical protein